VSGTNVTQLALRSAQAPTGKAQHTARGLAPGALGPPQHSLDPGKQLARVERFGEVVVGARLETDDAIGVLGDRGQHDDRQRGSGAQAAAEAEVVLAGEHQVEHHQVEPPGLQGARHAPAVGHGLDAQAVLAQKTRQQIADLAIVVDDQDLWSVDHGAIVKRIRRAVRTKTL
jgi:hypothetical protein